MPPESDALLSFEDLAAGQTFPCGTIAVTAEEIVGFASRYDPQPFHTDAVAAEGSAFGGLVASGWLTASLTMRLMVTHHFRRGGVIGSGVDKVRWPRPVRPGDTLTAAIEVLRVRASDSQPGYGLANLRTTTTNQRGETVMVMESHVLVPRKAG